MPRRSELLEKLVKLWLDLTREPLCVIVEGKHDANVISALPAHTRPLILELQRLGLRRTLELVQESGIKRVLVLTDFDVKGYRLARTLLGELRRLGVTILTEAREVIYKIFSRLHLRHIEQLAEFLEDIEKFTPFTVFVREISLLDETLA